MENSIVKAGGGNIPAFFQKSSETLEGMIKYGEILIASGLAPKHFANKPEAVVITIQHGLEIGMTPSQALQQIVPVNGLVTVKGDGAKALIISSGLCAKWEEKQSGSVKTEDFEITITATRKDNGETMSRSFCILRAKRAGLWVSKADVDKDYRKGFGAWYKYPDRMIRYRALGFLARDLFPDVLGGIYISEEASDIDSVPASQTLQNSSGQNITITKGAESVAQNIAKKIKQKVSKPPESKIEDAKIIEEGENKPPAMDADFSNEQPAADEYKDDFKSEMNDASPMTYNGKTIEQLLDQTKWSEEDLKACDTPQLKEIYVQVNSNKNIKPTDYPTPVKKAAAFYRRWIDGMQQTDPAKVCEYVIKEFGEKFPNHTKVVGFRNYLANIEAKKEQADNVAPEVEKEEPQNEPVTNKDNKSDLLVVIQGEGFDGDESVMSNPFGFPEAKENATIGDKTSRMMNVSYIFTEAGFPTNDDKFTFNLPTSYKQGNIVTEIETKQQFMQTAPVPVLNIYLGYLKGKYPKSENN